MKKLIVLGGLLLLVSAFVTGCATLETAKHRYAMRGQILEVDGDAVYLCIGSSDGAKVGQELTVYKFERTRNRFPKGSGAPSFTRDETGKIKITQIVDEHMATAMVISGEAKVNYVVELRKQ